MKLAPRKLLDQACTEPCPEPAEGLSKYPPSHPSEELLHPHGRKLRQLDQMYCQKTGLPGVNSDSVNANVHPSPVVESHFEQFS
jgi:hypothetical protein